MEKVVVSFASSVADAFYSRRRVRRKAKWYTNGNLQRAAVEIGPRMAYNR